MVELVQSMLDLHRQLSSAGPDHDRTLLARQDRGHGQADRQAGIRALWADGRGDRDGGGWSEIGE